jgi:hypothetical protein
MGNHFSITLYKPARCPVPSEQAQFLTEAFKQFDSGFWDCGTPQGLTRANWSDTVKLFATNR